MSGVEVTPELLRRIEEGAHLAPVAHEEFTRHYKPPMIAGVPAYLVVLALVRRVRELEAELEELFWSDET